MNKITFLIFCSIFARAVNAPAATFTIDGNGIVYWASGSRIYSAGPGEKVNEGFGTNGTLDTATLNAFQNSTSIHVTALTSAPTDNTLFASISVNMPPSRKPVAHSSPVAEAFAVAIETSAAVATGENPWKVLGLQANSYVKNYLVRFSPSGQVIGRPLLVDTTYNSADEVSALGVDNSGNLFAILRKTDLLDAKHTLYQCQIQESGLRTIDSFTAPEPELELERSAVWIESLAFSETGAIYLGGIVNNTQSVDTPISHVFAQRFQEGNFKNATIMGKELPPSEYGTAILLPSGHFVHGTQGESPALELYNAQGNRLRSQTIDGIEQTALSARGKILVLPQIPLNSETFQVLEYEPDLSSSRTLTFPGPDCASSLEE